MPWNELGLPDNPKPSDLIRKGWTQRAAARNKSGEPVSVKLWPECPSCWCIVGAISAVYWNDKDGLLPMDPCKHMERCCDLLGLPHGYLADWNDAPERTHQEVIDVLERAGL